ncbi:MAG: hypothetical protein KDK62_02525 [Chlamydiia bacterium]|nr:hypothetical protein [Chlamydiia bacterium]
MTGSSNNISSWHEDKEEQEAFLNLINSEGFILEDTVFEILASSKHKHRAELHPNKVFEGAPHRGGNRVEIDLWANIEGRIFLFESKRSDFDWVFLQNSSAKKDVHLFVGVNQKVHVTNRVLGHLTTVGQQVIEVLEEDEKPELVKNPKKPAFKILPKRSLREDYVHNYIRQALFNIEVLIHSQQNELDSMRENVGRVFIPVIVTNAKLLSGTYKSSDIDTNANLNRIDLQEISYAAVNHSEILKWGGSYESLISHIGIPESTYKLIEDSRYKDTHNKTVFVVNKNALIDFIEKMLSLE